MALIPFADYQLIPAGSNDPRIVPIIGILHVDGGNAYNLHDFFDGRSGGIESHGHIAKDGHLFQYRDTEWEADANHEANSFVRGGRLCGALSFESQGFADGEWTADQLAKIKRVMLWCERRHNIPLRVCPGPFEPGWGYHIMFGSPGPWTPFVKACPGKDRIAQFHDILVPWMKSPEEDEVLNNEDKEWLRNVVREEARAAVNEVLDVPMNDKDPGQAAFAGKSLRGVIKAVARATGAVK